MASVQAEPRTSKPLPEIHGNAQWVGPIDAALLDAGKAILFVNASGNRAYYWVQRITDPVKGRVTSYRLTKFGGKPGGQPTVYEVDVSFGGWQFAQCDCPDQRFRAGRVGGCRHRRALEAALKAVNLL